MEKAVLAQNVILKNPNFQTLALAWMQRITNIYHKHIHKSVLKKVELML